MSLISARHASFFDERSDDDRAAAPSLPALAFRPNEFSANAARLSPQEGCRTCPTSGGDRAAASSPLGSVLRPAAPPKASVPLKKRSRSWAQPEAAVGGDMLRAEGSSRDGACCAAESNTKRGVVERTGQVAAGKPSTLSL